MLCHWTTTAQQRNISLWFKIRHRDEGGEEIKEPSLYRAKQTYGLKNSHSSRLKKKEGRRTTTMDLWMHSSHCFWLLKNCHWYFHVTPSLTFDPVPIKTVLVQSLCNVVWGWWDSPKAQDPLLLLLKLKPCFNQASSHHTPLLSCTAKSANQAVSCHIRTANPIVPEI